MIGGCRTSLGHVRRTRSGPRRVGPLIWEHRRWIHRADVAGTLGVTNNEAESVFTPSGV